MSAEIAAAGALGPAGGSRAAARRPDHRRPRHRRAEAPLPAADRHRPGGVVPAVQRAGRRLRPRRPQRTAVRDGDEWVVNGQKVWTSGAPDRRPRHAHRPHRSRRAQAPGHLATSPSTMHQPGVDVRPLREMTGRALFNEVFLTDARVADDATDRRPEQRLGGGQHDAHVRAGRLGAGGGRRRLAPRRRAPWPATSRSGPATSSGTAASGTVQRHGRRRAACSSSWPSATARRRPGDPPGPHAAAHHATRSPGTTTCGPRRPRRRARTSPAWPTCPSSR